MLRNTWLRFSLMNNISSRTSIFFRAYSKKTDTSAANEKQTAYYTAKDVEFSPNRAKEVLQNYVLEAKQDICKDDPFIKASIKDAAEPCSEKEHAEVYQSFSSVNLHSVMQSNVPDPYSTRSKAPTHLNMPGSSSNQGYKYLSGKLQTTHHSKQ